MNSKKIKCEKCGEMKNKDDVICYSYIDEKIKWRIECWDCLLIKRNRK